MQNEVMLTVRQYAQEVERDERTVQRWLRDGKLPGVVQTNHGWLIPSGTPRPESRKPPAAPVDNAEASAARPPAREVVTQSRVALSQATSLAGALDQLPAFLPLEIAARLLGVPEVRIKEDPERFAAEPVDERRRLMVPQHVVRKIAGLQPR